MISWRDINHKPLKGQSVLKVGGLALEVPNSEVDRINRDHRLRAIARYPHIPTLAPLRPYGHRWLVIGTSSRAVEGAGQYFSLQSALGWNIGAASRAFVLKPQNLVVHIPARDFYSIWYMAPILQLMWSLRNAQHKDGCRWTKALSKATLGILCHHVISRLALSEKQPRTLSQQKPAKEQLNPVLPKCSPLLVPPDCPFRYLRYHLFETIRPLTWVHWGCRCQRYLAVCAAMGVYACMQLATYWDVCMSRAYIYI